LRDSEVSKSIISPPTVCMKLSLLEEELFKAKENVKMLTGNLTLLE
jgi:hypothetical protein